MLGRIGWIAAIFCACSAARFCLAAEPIAPPAEYHSPEHFVAQQRAQDYLPHAMAFLAKHPHDVRAPRVVHDVLMVATLRQKPHEIKAAKLRLVLYYPGSLPADFLMRTSQAKDIAALLKERFTDEQQPLDRDTLKRLSRSIGYGHHIFGAGFSDDELLAQAALAALDARAALALQARLKKPQSDAGKTVGIVLNQQLQLRDKFIELQSLRKYKTARAFQRFLLTELTDEEQREVGVQKIVIENLLHAQDLAAALPLLTALCKTEADPQLLFWLGWAQAASGDDKAAAATFTQLAQEFPSSTWSASGNELIKLLTTTPAAILAHEAALDAAIAPLMTTPPEVLEAKVIRHDASRPFQAYAGLNLVRDSAELVTSAGDQAQLAYRVGPDGAGFFVQGDAAIHEFAGNGMCPMFTFALERQPVGGFHFRFNFNTLPQGSGALGKSLQQLLQQPWVRDAAERRKLLHHARASGCFPAPVETNDDVQVLRWVCPQVETPELKPFELHLTSDHRFVALHAGAWSIKDVKYGPQRSVKLAAPAWPQLPVQSAAEMGASDFFRLFGAVMSLLGVDNKESEADVATSPAKLPR